MLSTLITIDVSKLTSYASATPSVINSLYKVVSTGDLLRIDKTVAGTGEMGDAIILTFQ